MMCYKDMTFCMFYDTCKHGNDCYKALTPEVREGAAKWWGNDEAPICVFGEFPRCYDEVK